MIGGDFRLGFDGYTTAVIAYDASASELGLALTDLPSIDSVDVGGVPLDFPYFFEYRCRLVMP